MLHITSSYRERERERERERDKKTRMASAQIMHEAILSDPVVFRENIAKEFLKLMSKSGNGDNGDNSKNENIGYNLEKSVLNYTIHEAGLRQIIKKWKNAAFCDIYLSRLRSMMANILTNTELREQIWAGNITPEEMSKISHQEMKPERWRILIERKSKIDKSRFDNMLQASTDMFTCKKCKSKKCTYYELQTRSADEPATIFVTCLDCGKNWKNS